MKEKIFGDLSKWSLNKSNLSRREFLNRSLLLTAGFTIAACSDNPLEPSLDKIQNITPKNVVIVGAGLSGLVAGYELKKAGFKVTILEASNRIGGRVYTIREPFDEGQFAEAGAARIPPDHNLTLKYANQFNLKLDPFYPNIDNYLNYIGGNRIPVTAKDFLQDKPWPGSVNHSEYKKIRGGTEKLPIAFSEQLQNEVIFDSPVNLIIQNENNVVIKTTDGREFTADRVLVTVPLPVLNKIEFLPSLSSEKIEAANGGYNYSASTRIFIEFSDRFWQNLNLNGWARSDWPEEIWQPTFDQSGDKGVILTYLRGSRATQIDFLNEEERVWEVINRFDRIFPGSIKSCESSYSFSWVKNEWSGSAFASPSEIQKSKYYSHLEKAEGRIHFAGEHISNYTGWMQGALASGLRAKNEIIEQMKLAKFA